VISLRKYLQRADTRTPLTASDPDIVPSDPRAEIYQALFAGFRSMLEALPCESTGSATGPAGPPGRELSRRLDQPLEPFDVLEIAGEAVMLWEQQVREAEGRRRLTEEERQESERQADLAGASLAALGKVLSAAADAAEIAGDGDPRARLALQDLRERCRKPLQPADLALVATDAAKALERDASSRRRLRQEQQRQSGIESELSKAMVRGFENLVRALPPASSSSAPAASPSREPVELPRGPLTADGVARVVELAVDALRNEQEANPESERRADALSQALLQALQILIGGIPLSGAESSEGPHPAAKKVGELLRRLEEPLVPFDVIEIASEALEVFTREAAPSLRRRPENEPGGAKPADLSGAFMEALRTLVEAMASSVEGETRPDGTQTPAALLQRLEGPVAPFEVLAIANEAVAAMEQDRRAIGERQRLRNEELQAMISMLAETVRSISEQKDASVGRLQRIERRIEQASMLEDLRLLKTSLAECLEAVREASAAQRKQSGETIQMMQGQISKVQSRVPAALRPRPEEVCRVSPAAEAMAAEFVAVFLLDRETSIAVRFGEDVRQSILKFLNQRLKEALLPSDRMVRWKRAAFVASLKRPGTVQDVRAELGSLARVEIPQFIEIGNRSIRLPISLSWAVFPGANFPSLDRLFEKVDEFIAQAQV
jgi:hypothetical protein